MNPRTRQIIKVLCVSLVSSLTIALIKIIYGSKTKTLTFIADGIHVFFDAGATIMGIVSVYYAGVPADDGHPYGHQKMEAVAALLLSVTLLFGGYEVAVLAYERLLNPHVIPDYSNWGVGIMVGGMILSFFLSHYESAQAKRLGSPFLTSDSLHNMSDFTIGFAALATLFSFKFKIPYVDAVTALLITIYLCYLSIKLLRMNFNPLVDGSVLDPLKVIEVAEGIEGVIHCHNVRSRGDSSHLFLDLNIHLPGNITLHKAHEITHKVESRLKAEFPGVVDVVIHTEPHDHPPCSKN